MSKQYRYLIAVSGGPDSMALLDMSMKKGYEIEVAHVNYHKRDTAKRDEDTVFSFCQKHNIPFHLLDDNSKSIKGNFQAHARDVRYDFFKKICEERKLDGVLIAHHKDDLIETYLMQIDKKLGVSYYGLRKTNIINGVKVIRPLLNKTKKQLTDYCIKNSVSFGIDESNNTDDYLRNRIRHSLIDKMTLKQKNELVKEINDKNRIIKEELKTASDYFKKEVFETDEFLNIPYLRRYLRQYFTHISNEMMDEMLRQLKDSKTCRFECEKKVLLKEYDKIEFFDARKPYEYIFNTYEEILKFKNKDVRFSKKGDSLNGVKVNEEDFPLTLRTYRENDSIRMRFGTKKINRFFIDRKILSLDREKWPLLFNGNNELILLPGLGCDLSHYSKIYNLFMIKL